MHGKNPMEICCKIVESAKNPEKQQNGALSWDSAPYFGYMFLKLSFTFSKKLLRLV